MGDFEGTGGGGGSEINETENKPSGVGNGDGVNELDDTCDRLASGDETLNYSQDMDGADTDIDEGNPQDTAANAFGDQEMGDFEDAGGSSPGGPENNLPMDNVSGMTTDENIEIMLAGFHEADISVSNDNPEASLKFEDNEPGEMEEDVPPPPDFTGLGDDEEEEADEGWGHEDGVLNAFGDQEDGVWSAFDDHGEDGVWSAFDDHGEDGVWSAFDDDGSWHETNDESGEDDGWDDGDGENGDDEGVGDPDDRDDGTEDGSDGDDGTGDGSDGDDGAEDEPDGDDGAEDGSDGDDGAEDGLDGDDGAEDGSDDDGTGDESDGDGTEDDESKKDFEDADTTKEDMHEDDGTEDPNAEQQEDKEEKDWVDEQIDKQIDKQVEKQVKEYAKSYDGRAEEVAQQSEHLGRFFTDHKEDHVEMVEEKGFEAGGAVQEAMANGGLQGETTDERIAFSEHIDYQTLGGAALGHDTGMSGGGYATEKNADGTYSARPENDSDFDEVRNNHSLNSALNMLENRETFNEMGYSDEQVDKMSAECMAHSKSSSEVYDLNSKADWSECFDKMDAGVEAYNEDHPDHKIEFDRSRFEGNDELFGELATETFALRMGDVGRDSSDDAEAQSGEKVHIDRSTINNDGVSAEDEVKDADITIGENGDSVDNMTSRVVHAGEQNIVENHYHATEDGAFAADVRINDGSSAPYCTQKALTDRMKEMETATDGKFELNLSFDSPCDDSAKEKYEGFRESMANKYKNIDINFPWD